MECLKATYGADDESIDNAPKEPPQQCCVEDPKSETLIRDENPEQQQQQQLTIPKSEEEEEEEEEQEKHNSNNNGDTTTTTTTNDDEEFEESMPRKKHKSLSACLDPPQPAPATKKPKKKSNNVWSKPTSRKGKKKIKSSNNNNNNNHNNNGNHISNGSNHQNHTSVVPDMAWITSAPRVPDRLDDSPEQTICLSKVYKAEKVELSEDRMSAGSMKGYRMVRATRGVSDGAWYFEIKIVRLGETGHTRLGWATGKGDLQAPVGYDANSFGYRDIDGSKVHKALRERYGEDGYREGDVVGFYISLPEGNSFAPKPPQTVWIKGQRYLYSDDGKDNPPKVVPGSEISFFKNGLCQGVAFKDLFGGCYYPAASMYTLPNQPNCEVKFNFGPDFEFFPQDFDGRPVPKPMIEVPYDGGVDGITENGTSNDRKN